MLCLQDETLPLVIEEVSSSLTSSSSISLRHMEGEFGSISPTECHPS